MKNVSISSYGDYKGGNYGVHAMRVSIGNLTIYFSYSTPIAFTLPGEVVIRKNDWSTTTGKHLNAIDPDKKRRIDGEDFENRLSDILVKLGLELPKIAA